MKNKIFYVVVLIAFITAYYLYEESEYQFFFQQCKTTQDNKQIGQCSDDNRLNDYQKLLYLREKSQYITGGSTLTAYWGYSTLFNTSHEDGMRDNLIIIQISKKCVSVDSSCLYVYVDKVKPSDIEKFSLYERYLSNLLEVCDSRIYLTEYILLAEKLSFPVKFNKKCY